MATQVGIIGAGTMGGALALLLADNGVEVSVHDIWETNLLKVSKAAEDAGLSTRVHICKDYDTLCASLGSPKVFIFSLPNGRPGDSVVETLKKYVVTGDVVIDASNESHKVTQARQQIIGPYGVAYIGLGVSGGSYGARNGPSLMPGGEKWAVDSLLPILTKIAARDELGRPCVDNIGTGGSGHFVKMIHNGIEHGVMSALAEAWGFMDKCLKMNGNEIADVFDSWNAEGGLVSSSGIVASLRPELTFQLQKGNFLVSISGPICRTKGLDGAESLLHQIRDAIVQDANDSEGTGCWANVQAVESHVPAPSLTTAHYLRIASSQIEQRIAVNASLGTTAPAQLHTTGTERAEILQHLHNAVYLTTLMCFVQGLDTLERENENQKWGVNIPRVLEIWKAGCIIKSDAISEILQASYAEGPHKHLLCKALIAAEVKKCQSSLKRVVLQGIEVDAHVPCLSATLEYLKYIGGTDLPTSFTEAQLDSFGAHGYDLRSEPVRHMLKGSFHDEWSG